MGALGCVNAGEMAAYSQHQRYVGVQQRVLQAWEEQSPGQHVIRESVLSHYTGAEHGRLEG